MLAIVPVKGLDGAKSRLAPALAPDERAQLVVDMLDRVLAACDASTAITRTLLVTPEPELARNGVEVLQDAVSSGRHRGCPLPRRRRHR